jgi:hypothetical protein
VKPEPGDEEYEVLLCGGIDRIDSTQGYTKANSRSCCTMCNKAKSNTPESVFLDWVARVYRNLGLGKTDGNDNDARWIYFK